ncbi:unnamed protein product, partial [Symbiodinium pilosum]
AILSKGIDLMQHIRGTLQQHNTHLWQLAALGSRLWRGRPNLRLGAYFGERYHTISGILQTYCHTCGREAGAVYAEVGVFEGDTPLHLAKVALPSLKEMHFIEPDPRYLQLAGARVAEVSRAQRWTSCFEVYSPLNPNTLAAHPPQSSVLWQSATSRFVCLEPTARTEGSVFLHLANGTSASKRFLPGSLDVVFLDATSGKFQLVLQHLD